MRRPRGSALPLRRRKALTDLPRARESALVEQGLGREKHARGAKAALQGRVVDEGLFEALELGQLRESLDRQHLTAVDVRDERATSADRGAVDEHGARPANLCVTRALCSGESAILTEIVE